MICESTSHLNCNQPLNIISVCKIDPYQPFPRKEQTYLRTNLSNTDKIEQEDQAETKRFIGLVLLGYLFQRLNFFECQSYENTSRLNCIQPLNIISVKLIHFNRFQERTNVFGNKFIEYGQNIRLRENVFLVYGRERGDFNVVIN